MNRRAILLAALFAIAFCGPAPAFYNLQQYAQDRVLARKDPRTRAILDARIDGIASGLFTANGLYADGLYREGFFCLPYDVTLSVKDFQDLLDKRLSEYQRDGLFEQVKQQSAAATIEFELRRRYPCGRDRGDPFPPNYVFPDGTPASVYRNEMAAGRNQAQTGGTQPPAYPGQPPAYRNLAPQYRTQKPAFSIPGISEPASPNSGRTFTFPPLPTPITRSGNGLE